MPTVTNTFTAFTNGNNSVTTAGAFFSSGSANTYFVGVQAPKYGRNLGLRFPGVNIPNGATISSSVLNLPTFTANGTPSPLPVFYGAKVANISAWAYNGTTRVATQPQTTANVATSATNTFTVTSIVQEIINQGSWVSGNALAILAINKDVSARSTTREMTWVNFTGTHPNLVTTYANPVNSGASFLDMM